MNYGEAIVDSITFGKAIRSMQKRVRRLFKDVQKAKRGDPNLRGLEADAERCHERLERLLDYAERNPVMTQSDRDIADATLQKLEQIDRLIQERQPWWKQLLGWLKQAIKVLYRLLDVIRVVVPILPNGVREPVIAFLVAHDVIKGLISSAEQDRF